MEKVISIFLSPLAFAIGFLTPLIAQVLLAMGWTSDTTVAYGIGFVIAISFGTVAQLRGSWLWLKS